MSFCSIAALRDCGTERSDGFELRVKTDPREILVDTGVANMANCRQCDLCMLVREHIRKALTANFRGEKYIKLVHLKQLLTTTFVHELLCHIEGYSKAKESFNSANNQKRTEEVERKALRILALCIWADVPLRTFRTIFDHGIRDEHLPLNETSNLPLIKTATLEHLLQNQSWFLPYTLCDDGAHHNVPSELPLAIHFEELDDRIGAGSFGEVFKVEVDVAASTFCQTAVFAVKRFHTSKCAEIVFHRERMLLQKLRNRPHHHIVTHMTSIVNQGTFYIFFPLAESNLRAFLNRVTALPLRGDVVMWFFSQLKGLADAVLHLHALGDPPAKRQWTRDHDFIPSSPVLHGDIKPENILVFAPTGGAPLGTFKLSDFGSAQTSEDSPRSLTHEEIWLGGTEAYESPDVLHSKHFSCATDIWSLGCVFLELFVWLFYPPGSEETGFMTQRSIDTLSRSSSFWKLTEAGKAELKPSVTRRLLDLEYTPCSGKLALEYLLQLVWSILITNPTPETEIFSALRVSHDLEECIRQVERDLAQDPNYFLNPKASIKGYDSSSPTAPKRKRKDRWAFYKKYQIYSGLLDAPQQ